MRGKSKAGRSSTFGSTTTRRRMLPLVRRYGGRILVVSLAFVVLLINAGGIVGKPFNFSTVLHFDPTLVHYWREHSSLPAFAKAPDFILLFITGLALSILLPVLSPIRASMATVLAMVPPFWMAYFHPANRHSIPLEYMLLTILVLYVVNVLASYFSETKARQELVGIFGHYVPPELAQIIARSPDSFSMEGEAREMTIFFCDIKNFSTFSEQMDPRQLARMLNHYFTAMTDVLHHHGATIDKYIGDSIMAFWSAPIVQADHARRSVLAALAMLESLERLRVPFREHDWPDLDIGVGINTGVMNVGNMGSKYRVAYTVMGDAVNLCSRIERLTRVYNARILVTESTMANVQDVIFKEVDFVRVRGKGNPTRVFEAICRTDSVNKALLDNLAVHQRALACYYRQEWDEADALLHRLHEADFNRPYCQLMQRRIANYRKQSPPANWSGVTNYSRRPMD